jgi:hypothetical protein
MKTNNIFTKCVVIVVMFFVATSANAQTQNERANFNDQAVVATIVADSLMGTGCALVTAHVENSLVDRVDAKIHSGFYVEADGVYSYMVLNSTDKGKGNTNSVGVEVSLGYEWCKKNWILAPGFKATFGGYSNTTIEGKNTKALVAGLDATATAFAHSPVSVNVAVGMNYRNVTSSTDINTEFLEGDVSGFWNGWEKKVELNFLLTLFHFNSGKTMDVAGQKVKAVKHRPFRLVAGVEYGDMTVDKPVINGQHNKLSIKEFKVKVGFKTTF